MGKKRLSCDHVRTVYAAMSPSGMIALATVRDTPLEAAEVNARFNPSVNGHTPPMQIVSLKIGWNIDDTAEMPL